MMSYLTMRTTQEQRDEQINLEREAISQGLKRLQDQTIKLEDQNYASATVYGTASIDALLPSIIERIDKTNKKIHEGHYGVAFKDIHVFLKTIDSQSAAVIACKVTFDKIFSSKDDANVATNVCESIGCAVEDECQMRHYEENAPGLLNKLKENYWHRSCGTKQKLVVIRTLMNRYEVKQWKTWSNPIRVKLGSWLLDCVMKSSGWFQKFTIREGRKTIVYIVPTPEFMDQREELMANAELFSPLAWPMLIPPNDWSNESPGGYILNEVMHGHDLVRRGEVALIQGEVPLAFLNKIQKVAYRLNPFTVQVAETLQTRGISVGKFLPIINYDLPPKPADIA